MAKWLTCAIVVAIARAAAADPDPKDHAQQLYEEGSKHYKLREYEQAIAAFREAYAAFPEPSILFDIAQAYRQLNDCDNALAFYKNYLRDKPDADDRAKVEKLEGEMDTCISERKQREQEQRDAERAKLQAQTAVAPLPAAPPQPQPQPQHRGLRIAGLITAGAGAITAGVGVYFSLDAAHQAHQLELACMTQCAAKDVAAIDSAGNNSQRNALVLYAIGGTALATGAAMFTWAVLHEDEVTITPQPGGATVGMTRRF